MGGIILLIPLWYAFCGTAFTFILTMLGAAVVFLFNNHSTKTFEHIFIGFSAGVMIAASIWSLLLPAIERSNGNYGWLICSIGFLAGSLFLLAVDTLTEHLPDNKNPSNRKNWLFVFAVTLHNIPEGMAVGIAFALAAQGSTISLASAIALALGIGLQNFPEGAAISLPLHQSGYNKSKAFLIGTLSGIVEPIAGTLTVLFAQQMNQWLPWVLSFAAGSMIYVVVEELIPNKEHKDSKHRKTIGIILGFTIMMMLDVALS